MAAPERYELIIIGAGPAGITAGVYAARKRMRFLMLTDDIGGQTIWSGDIENYTGYQFVTGPELAAKFEEHMRNYGIAVHEREVCRGLKVLPDGAIRVETDKAAYESRTVIIASGKRSRELGVPGEKEFKNRGVAYCATCDGPLFSRKAVAVVGGGNSALDAALQLVKICTSVSVLTNADSLSGDAVMQEQLFSNPLVTVYRTARITGIQGERFVQGITFLHEGKEKKLAVEGVFVEIGLIPNSSFAEAVARNPYGEILVNAANETNVPGIFAAGDVTDVPEKQIIVAAGEGAKACLSAFKYLLQHPQ